MAMGSRERAALLRRARAAIEAAVAGTPLPSANDEERGLLSAQHGLFVTVRHRGELRGCRGILEPIGPLYEAVAEIARLSATDDPRFPPVRPDELPGLTLDVSILYERRPISGPDEIVLGRDGLLLTHRGHRGFLLPQVAVEHHLDAPTFLDRLCNKAGLPDGAWREPGAKIEAFEVEYFGDPDEA